MSKKLNINEINDIYTCPICGGELTDTNNSYDDDTYYEANTCCSCGRHFTYAYSLTAIYEEVEN